MKVIILNSLSSIRNFFLVIFIAFYLNTGKVGILSRSALNILDQRCLHYGVTSFSYNEFLLKEYCWILVSCE
jgi:hypothetical protein